MLKVYNIGTIDIPNAPRYSGYRTWIGMLKRVITDKSYKDVSICEEWLTFSNFLRWYLNHVVKGWQLDKDLKGHKLYSPETCVYLPAEINLCLQRHTGVCLKEGKWVAEYSRGGVIECIGEFETENEARDAYIREKRSYLDWLILLNRFLLDRNTLELLRNYIFE